MSSRHKHHHGQHHDHGPSPEEAAASPALRRKLAIAFCLIFSIVIAQGLGAWLSGSLALLVDMVHSLVDSLGLLIALVAAHLMLRPPDKHRTWGFRRAESLAALAQGSLLLGISLFALLEGVDRWIHPPEVDPTRVIAFGAVALLLNLSAMLVLHYGKDANLNMRGAFLEVAMDALGTLAVILSGVLMLTTGYARADTIAALLIAAMIVPRAGLLLRDALRMLLNFTPEGLDLDKVREHIMGLDHVIDVHDMHAYDIATGLPTLSAHVVVDDKCFTTGHAAEILQSVRECVATHFDVSIEHSTFQIETREIARQERPELIHN